MTHRAHLPRFERTFVVERVRAQRWIRWAAHVANSCTSTTTSMPPSSSGALGSDCARHPPSCGHDLIRAPWILGTGSWFDLIYATGPVPVHDGRSPLDVHRGRARVGHMGMAIEPAGGGRILHAPLLARVRQRTFAQSWQMCAVWSSSTRPHRVEADDTVATRDSMIASLRQTIQGTTQSRPSPWMPCVMRFIRDRWSLIDIEGILPVSPEEGAIQDTVDATEDAMTPAPRGAPMRSVPSGMQDGVPMTFDVLEVARTRHGPPLMSDKRKKVCRGAVSSPHLPEPSEALPWTKGR